MSRAEMSVELKRDCEAALIPSGIKVTVKAGTPALVTQSLGNAYTVYVNGNLVRIAGKDGDALGLVTLDDLDINTLDGTVEDKVWMQLQTCFDPEIPVNIVDLGLVYTCRVIAVNDNQFKVEIIMTLTAAGCGMGPVLVGDIEQKIRAINEVVDIKVELVFDPPWDRSKMSEVAKLQLGLF